MSRQHFPIVATLTVLAAGIVACAHPSPAQAGPCPPPICATADACRRAADWVVEGRVLEYVEGGYGRSCHVTLPFLSEACRFPTEPPTVLLDHAIEVRGRSDLVSQGMATLPQAAACPLPVMAQTGPIQPPDLGSAMVGQQYRFYGFGGRPGSPQAVYVFAEPVAGALLPR